MSAALTDLETAPSRVETPEKTYGEQLNELYEEGLRCGFRPGVALLWARSRAEEAFASEHGEKPWLRDPTPGEPIV